MTMTAAERDKADAYAGPGHSFPLYSSGAHLRAAWDLAGHAANPGATRAKILAFARRHNLTHLLPSTAKALDFAAPSGNFWEDGERGPTTGGGGTLAAQAGRRGTAPSYPFMSNIATSENGLEGAGQSGGNPRGNRVYGKDSTDPRQMSTKAASEGMGLTSTTGGGEGSRAQPRVREMLQMAYDHAEMSGGPGEVIDYAQRNGLTRHLPERAHGYMHRVGMRHLHDGEDDPDHTHLITKARNVVVKVTHIQKAWGLDDGSAVIEGWVSTEDQDSEHDIVPPESFSRALPQYAARCMPLSSEHKLKELPIGHGQQVALVRDGAVFAKAQHPTDPHDFEHFPGSGTGVYGRFLITDPQHATAVKAGNVGGFSFVGNLREFEPLPGGGRRFVTIDPWLESTVAAYPVNTKALLVAAKAYEGELPEEEATNMDQTLEELLQGALAAAEREEAEARKAKDGVTRSDLAALMAQLDAKLTALVETAVQKALPVDRTGVGRVGTVPAEDPRDADPAAYIVKAMREGKELSDADKDLVWGLSHAALSAGMQDAGN